MNTNGANDKSCKGCCFLVECLGKWLKHWSFESCQHCGVVYFFEDDIYEIEFKPPDGCQRFREGAMICSKCHQEGKVFL
jgi:hypothetical protein